MIVFSFLNIVSIIMQNELVVGVPAARNKAISRVSEKKTENELLAFFLVKNKVFLIVHSFQCFN